jgi:hypothetical protein
VTTSPDRDEPRVEVDADGTVSLYAGAGTTSEALVAALLRQVVDRTDELRLREPLVLRFAGGTGAGRGRRLR